MSVQAVGYSESLDTLAVRVIRALPGRAIQEPAMLSRRSYAAAAAAGGHLVVLGGWDGESERRLESAEALDIRVAGRAGPAAWRRLPDMSCPRYGLAAVALPAELAQAGPARAAQ